MRCEDGKSLAEVRVAHEPGPGRVGGIANGGVVIVGGDVADAAEAVAAGADVGLEHGLDARTKGQVRMADDAGADLAHCRRCRWRSWRRRR